MIFNILNKKYFLFKQHIPFKYKYMKNKINFQQEIKLKQENNHIKHFPSSIREWNNSIYTYNKNNLNLIPFSSMYAIKIIRSFFNFYNKILEKKIRTKSLLLRFRRLSSNRIYLSKGEFKHSNNNVLINIYIFNRQKMDYLLKLKKVFLNKFIKNKKYIRKTLTFLNLINKKALNTIEKINKNKYLLIKVLHIIKENKNYKINSFKSLNSYVIIFYKKLLYLTMKKLRLFFFYKQLIYLNKSKLNYTYLRLLKKHLEKLYNKNVEFNLVNLKRFYLNSDIFTESVKLKIALNKNKMRKMLKKLKIKVKIHKKQILGFKPEIKNIYNTNLLKKDIFNKLKYRHVTGFRLETKGRLSKRFTASRSVYKLYYKGNLINIDSSLKQESSILLKGNLKANIQYTKLSSVTRIGAFGLKSWISGN